MKKKNQGKNHRVSKGEDPILLPGASSLLMDETSEHSGDEQEGLQRDMEPDDFDASTSVNDDRVRGAGGQSLAELVISQDKGWGLDEHGGGIRFDRPEPNANDYDPDEPTELEPTIFLEENAEEKNRIA
jgi:hypothetical protein